MVRNLLLMRDNRASFEKNGDEFKFVAAEEFMSLMHNSSLLPLCVEVAAYVTWPRSPNTGESAKTSNTRYKLQNAPEINRKSCKRENVNDLPTRTVSFSRALRSVLYPSSARHFQPKIHENTLTHHLQWTEFFLLFEARGSSRNIPKPNLRNQP